MCSEITQLHFSSKRNSAKSIYDWLKTVSGMALKLTRKQIRLQIDEGEKKIARSDIFAHLFFQCNYPVFIRSHWIHQIPTFQKGNETHRCDCLQWCVHPSTDYQALFNDWGVLSIQNWKHSIRVWVEWILFRWPPIKTWRFLHCPIRPPRSISPSSEAGSSRTWALRLTHCQNQTYSWISTSTNAQESRDLPGRQHVHTFWMERPLLLIPPTHAAIRKRALQPHYSTKAHQQHEIWTICHSPMPKSIEMEKPM